MLVWLPEDCGRLPKHVEEDIVSLYMLCMCKLLVLWNELRNGVWECTGLWNSVPCCHSFKFNPVTQYYWKFNLASGKFLTGIWVSVLNVFNKVTSEDFFFLWLCMAYWSKWYIIEHHTCLAQFSRCIHSTCPWLCSGNSAI